MAMSKEDQSAAARRIMEKEPSFTEEERVTYELLARNPDEYVPPDPETGWRRCGACGEMFQNKGTLTALEQFADHTTKHNPSPVHWGEAHKRILAGKQSQKEERQQQTS